MTAQEFNTEYIQVKDVAYRYAASLLHSREEAEDIVQDLYEKLWRRRLLVRKKGFGALVMTSTRNMCMDVLRGKQKGWQIEVAGQWESTEGLKRGESMAVSGVWEEEKEREDMVAIVEKLVAALPQREREAFHLRVVEELDYPLIAQIMGINESAARMACSRGRSKVKEELGKIMDYGVERK